MSFFDDDNNGSVELEEWMVGLSTAFKGTLEERMDYVFKVYDFNGKGQIHKDELYFLLKDAVVKRPPDEDAEEGVKDLVEIALQLLDVDRDGRISFNDFKTAVTRQPLLLEAFGKCLPDILEVEAFLSTCSSASKKTDKDSRQTKHRFTKYNSSLAFMHEGEDQEDDELVIRRSLRDIERSEMVDVGCEVKRYRGIPTNIRPEGTSNGEITNALARAQE